MKKESSCSDGCDQKRDTKEIIVKGMSCNHCKASVEKNLSKLSNIQSVQVDLAKGKVILQGSSINLNQVKEMIADLGYEVIDC